MRPHISKEDISIFDLIAAVLFWGLTIAWIVMIFYFSSESGEMSSDRSLSALQFIELLFGKGFMTEEVLRKLAHILEFAVLTALAFMSVRYTNRISIARSYAESPVKLIKSDNEMYIVITLWISMLTAVIDEYHQLFVDGRSGSIIDVLVDSIGVIIVLLIVRIIFTIYLKYIGSKEIRYE